MTKILFYGGCHALVLCNLFEELFDAGTVEVSYLINFQLIASGAPFPLERLDHCDVLVYSPIENKGSYNTELLRRPCEARNIRMLAFPWMEWHGYCPGATKGFFKGRFQWYYPKLLELSEKFDTFGAFVDHVVAHFPDDQTIDLGSSWSLDRVAAGEERHAMAIRISGFIERNFRTSRLFLISDHPSLALYVDVIGQIVDVLALPRPRTCRSGEPQWRWRTPIFPRVEERLGLAFTDTDWIDDELVPGRTSRLETYLSLYYHKDAVILGPGAGTAISFAEGSSLQLAPVGATTRLFANPVACDSQTGLETYDVLEALSDPDVLFPPSTRFAIEPAHWRSTWDF